MVRDNKSYKGTFKQEKDKDSKVNLSSKDLYDYNDKEITFYLGSNLKSF